MFQRHLREIADPRRQFAMVGCPLEDAVSSSINLPATNLLLEEPKRLGVGHSVVEAWGDGAGAMLLVAEAALPRRPVEEPGSFLTTNALLRSANRGLAPEQDKLFPFSHRPLQVAMSRSAAPGTWNRASCRLPARARSSSTASWFCEVDRRRAYAAFCASRPCCLGTVCRCRSMRFNLGFRTLVDCPSERGDQSLARPGTTLRSLMPGERCRASCIAAAREAEPKIPGSANHFRAAFLRANQR